jgi:hypothetical protein
MMYAQPCSDVLRSQGMPSYSGLHVLVGEDWHTFFLRIEKRVPQAQINIWHTEEIFQSTRDYDDEHLALGLAPLHLALRPGGGWDGEGSVSTQREGGEMERGAYHLPPAPAGFAGVSFSLPLSHARALSLFMISSLTHTPNLCR